MFELRNRRPCCCWIEQLIRNLITYMIRYCDSNGKRRGLSVTRSCSKTAISDSPRSRAARNSKAFHLSETNEGGEAGDRLLPGYIVARLSRSSSKRTRIRLGRDYNNRWKGEKCPPFPVNQEGVLSPHRTAQEEPETGSQSPRSLGTPRGSLRADIGGKTTTANQRGPRANR